MIESGLSCKCVGGDASWCYDTPLFPLFRTDTLLQAQRLGKRQVGGNGLDIMYKIFAGCINGGVTKLMLCRKIILGL